MWPAGSVKAQRGKRPETRRAPGPHPRSTCRVWERHGDQSRLLGARRAQLGAGRRAGAWLCRHGRRGAKGEDHSETSCSLYCKMNFKVRHTSARKRKRARRYTSVFSTLAVRGWQTQGGRRPVSLRLPSCGSAGSWGAASKPGGRPPDPSSSQARTPAGGVQQVQDTQTGGKTRPDGDVGPLCVHRWP